MNPWNHLKRSLQSERGSWVITAVVLTTASAGMSFMSAFAAGKNAKNQTQAVADQAKRNADLKARSTVRLAATQRMSFLQSGISLTGYQFGEHVDFHLQSSLILRDVTLIHLSSFFFLFVRI